MQPRRLFCAVSALTLAASGVLAPVLVIAGPSTSVAGAATTAKTVTASNQYWKVSIKFSRTSARAGVGIPATLTINNLTKKSVKVTGCAEDGDYTVYVHSKKASAFPNSGVVACSGTMLPGIHTFHTTISTKYQSCGGSGVPACGHPRKLSALPVGTYKSGVVLPGSTHKMPSPKEIQIKLTT